MLENLNRAINMLLDDDEDSDAEDLAFFRELVLAEVQHRAYRPPEFRPRLLRPDLLWPDSSPWEQIWREKNDRALLQVVRLDFDAFFRLHNAFPQEWIDKRRREAVVGLPRRQGRPNNLDSYGVLALTLMWFASRCEQKQLELIFGSTESCVSRDLKEGRELLLMALSGMSDAIVDEQWPKTLAEFELLHDSIIARMMAEDWPPPLPGKWFGFVDGLRLRVKEPATVQEQQDLYTGWLHELCCLNILVFSTDGRIMWRSRNHPGRTHDISHTAFLRLKLIDRDCTPEGWALIGDDGFSSRSLEMLIDTKAPPTYYVPQALWNKFAVWLTAVRQSAEWGMQTLQSMWPRITCPLPTNARVRSDLLDTSFMLHNFMTNAVGRNQNRTVFLESVLRGGMMDANGLLG